MPKILLVPWGDYHMKGAGMLVVSPWGVNFGSWPHFCLVPRPHYSMRPKCFGSRGSRIRHRSELNESDWENAAQGLGKSPA